MTKSDKLLRNMAILAVILLALSIWSICHAAEIRLQWDHPGATDLDCFELQVNGDNDTLINIPGDIRQWTGTCVLNDDNNTLAMRAKDLAGQMSEWSEPCIFNPTPEVPSNLKISVIITIDVE